MHSFTFIYAVIQIYFSSVKKTCIKFFPWGQVTWYHITWSNREIIFRPSYFIAKIVINN